MFPCYFFISYNFVSYQCYSASLNFISLSFSKISLTVKHITWYANNQLNYSELHWSIFEKHHELNLCIMHLADLLNSYFKKWQSIMRLSLNVGVYTWHIYCFLIVCLYVHESDRPFRQLYGILRFLAFKNASGYLMAFSWKLIFFI